MCECVFAYVFAELLYLKLPHLPDYQDYRDRFQPRLQNSTSPTLHSPLPSQQGRALVTGIINHRDRGKTIMLLEDVRIEIYMIHICMYKLCTTFRS